MFLQKAFTQATDLPQYVLYLVPNFNACNATWFFFTAIQDLYTFWEDVTNVHFRKCRNWDFLLSPLGVSNICKKASFLVTAGYIIVQWASTRAFCIRAWLNTIYTSITNKRWVKTHQENVIGFYFKKMWLHFFPIKFIINYFVVIKKKIII